HRAAVHAMAFSPDGRTLFTGSLDGAIFKWALASSGRFGVPFSLAARPAVTGNDAHVPPPLAVSSDSRRYATVSGPSLVELSDVRTGSRTATLRVRTPRVDALAFAPHTPLLAATGVAGVAQLWDVAGRPRLLRRLTGLRSINGDLEDVATVAF